MDQECLRLGPAAVQSTGRPCRLPVRVASSDRLLLSYFLCGVRAQRPIDAEADRRRPGKQHGPIAAWRKSSAQAVGLIGILLASATVTRLRIPACGVRHPGGRIHSQQCALLRLDQPQCDCGRDVNRGGVRPAPSCWLCGHRGCPDLLDSCLRVLAGAGSWVRQTPGRDGEGNYQRPSPDTPILQLRQTGHSSGDQHRGLPTVTHDLHHCP